MIYSDFRAEKNEHAFDAVVMLTWSNWRSEPRSNRYHYATRFAKLTSVYFVQPDRLDSQIVFEGTECHNITLVHVPQAYNAQTAELLCAALNRRGVRRPLAWVYNVYFGFALRRLSPILTIFHATEDYVSPVDTLRAAAVDISESVQNFLESVDMIVAVSEGVAQSYREHSGFTKQILVLPNGCDFSFWEETSAASYAPPVNGAKVALFQGGINRRLDFMLLSAVTQLLPDWQFWFCGRANDGGAEWESLRRKDNVRYFGEVSAEGIADLSRQAMVGLIPFKQDALMQRSLPLKAYEYVACGLPVVTIPIDALAEHPSLFSVASDPAAFAAAIADVAPSRTDAAALANRLAAARASSYDQRFEELRSAIDARIAVRRNYRPRLNVLMLYDDRSTHVGTVREHLDAFQKYSRHNFHFLPATGQLEVPSGDEILGRINVYDAILIHYCVRLSLDNHLSPAIADAVENYHGPKLLFIQDEYDTTNTTLAWMERLGIDAVFTNVPAEGQERVYPRSRFPKLDLLPTLTGYVPEDSTIEIFITPLAQREVLIGYRGRRLPHQYGALGQEKFRIGIEMKRIAAERGIRTDIEVDDSHRIYGPDWYRFMGSVRATLGTESGANVFDFDGRLAALAAEHRDMAFSEFAGLYLTPHEGLVKMNQISPKIFEAIRLRTALILFEGEYSGVVEPNRHFIPLKKDFSNVDTVLAKLENLDYIHELTDRAYDEIVGSGRYSYVAFMQGIDDYIDKRALGRRRATILSVPFMAIYADGDVKPLWAEVGPNIVLNDVVLTKSLSRELVMGHAADQVSERRTTWVAEELERLALQDADRLAEETEAVAAMPRRRSLIWRSIRAAWRILPATLRAKIAFRIKSAMS